MPILFWRVSHYRTLAEELHRRHGMSILLVGGRSERAFADSLKALRPTAPVIDLVEATNLRGLVSIFASCRAAVGSDSGPMHIAAAVGTPVISLWGSTSPQRSAPYGSESLVLQSAIGCSPCYRKRCPRLDTLCMQDIPRQAVIARLEQVMAVS